MQRSDSPPMATVDLEVGERSDGHENDSQSDPTTTSGPHIAEQALPLPLQRNHSAHADTTFFQRTLAFITTWRSAFAFPLISLCITLPLFYPFSLAYVYPSSVAIEKATASRLCTAMAGYASSISTFITPLSTFPLGSFLTTIGYQYCLIPSQGNISMSSSGGCPQVLTDAVSCSILTSAGAIATLSLYPNSSTMSTIGWLPVRIYYLIILLPICVALLIAIMAGFIGYLHSRVSMNVDKMKSEADYVKALMVRQYELIEVLGIQREARADRRRSNDDFNRTRSRGPQDDVQLVNLLDSVEATKHHLKASNVELLAAKDEIALLDLLPWSSADVYKGSWRGSAVAVKSIVLTDQLSLRSKSEFIALLEMALSSAISHPHIVQLYTYSIKTTRDTTKINLADKRIASWRSGLMHSSSYDSKSQSSQPLEVHRTTDMASSSSSSSPSRAVEVLLCFEFCDCGTLRDMLDSGAFLDREGLNYPAILQTAIDIARALSHLHANGTVLGDLTASSVWLKRDFSDGRGVVAKVADFGKSVNLGSSSPSVHASDSFHGTITHVAPEIILEGKLSKASDVYSFGILLFELFTSGRPFPNSSPLSLLRDQIIKERKRPSFPLVVPQGYQSLAEECWSHDPELRPSFESIVNRLMGFKMGLTTTMRPLKKITLLAAMIQKSQVNQFDPAKRSLEGLASTSAAAETAQRITGSARGPARRSNSFKMDRTMMMASSPEISPDAPGSKTGRGRFISGALPSSPLHPPSSDVNDIMMIRTSPAPLHLPLPPPSHLSNMERSSSTPSPKLDGIINSDSSNATYASGSDGDGSDSLHMQLMVKRSLPLNRSPLSAENMTTTSLDRNAAGGREGKDDEEDELAILLSSLKPETTVSSTPPTRQFDTLTPPSPTPLRFKGVYSEGVMGTSHELQGGGSWEEGEGIVLVPGTILSDEGAYVPDDPPLPEALPSFRSLADHSSIAGRPSVADSWMASSSGGGGGGSSGRLGPVAKAVARMKNTTVRKSTTCSMETIDEASIEGEAPNNNINTSLASSVGPRQSSLGAIAAPRELKTTKSSSSGPQPLTMASSSSTAAAVASLVGTLSVQGLPMMTRHSNEGNNRDDMNISSGQMRTLGEQQAHRAVMEAKRALVDSDNSVLLIGKEVGDMSGQLFE